MAVYLFNTFMIDLSLLCFLCFLPLLTKNLKANYYGTTYKFHQLILQPVVIKKFDEKN